MNNGTMPASPTVDMDMKMTREEFDNKTAGGRYLPSYGLSKREHFAGLAIQALVSDSSLSPSEASRLAIDYADALLAELDK
tara:strand:+ start:212 stop:454 length:243 start_codon:yes stop_codon:yes gene_type:complete